MNLTFTIKFGVFWAIAAIGCVATSVQADIPAFILGNVLTNEPLSFTGTRGMRFARSGANPANEILVTQLGVFDSGGDGLINPHSVGLWREDPGNLTGTLLVSVTVAAGTSAPLIGGYRWVSISPIFLSGLSLYDIGAFYSAGDADDMVTPRPSQSGGVFQFAPHVSFSFVGGKVAFGPDLSFPASFIGAPEGQLGELFFEPNFQYDVVPEPSVLLLLSPALLYPLLRYLKRH